MAASPEPFRDYLSVAQAVNDAKQKSGEKKICECGSPPYLLTPDSCILYSAFGCLLLL
jgi:hypothetical protein